MTTDRSTDFSSWLPHRPPMLMLTSILSQEEDNIHCNCIIRADNPLLRGDLFPVTSGVELLAQAGGILLGTRARDAASQAGAIVQIKSFQVETLRIPVGADIHIHAHYQAGSFDAALFDGEVIYNDQTFFTGTLMIALLPAESV